MKKLLLSAITVLLFVFAAQAVLVDGYCYLENQTNHSGTMVVFQADVAGQTDTTYTQASGYYQIDLSVGVYDVYFTHQGYWEEEILDQLLVSTTTLPEVMLTPTGIEISGEQSGVIVDTTYGVIGDIWVSSGDSLTIEAGTELIFSDGVQFDINGYINATGTETDSIKFINFPDLTWGGIDFNDSADDNSMLEYCLITGSSSSGIFCGSSSPSIVNCTISGNTAEYNGGGIYCDLYSSPSISSCAISGNTAINGYGGGIFCYYYSSPAIENCTIIGNSANYGAGGIYCYSSSPTISNCTISGNTADNGNGGGILCDFSSPEISNCTVSGNTAYYGGGLYMYYSSPAIVNTIVEGNFGYYGVYLLYNSPNTSITYGDFYNNQNGNFGGSVPQWLGQIVTVNANGDSCDLWMNIFEDPLFIDPGNNNFNLDSTSACIDAGDPESPLDPDSTIADIGAFYYDQSGAPPEPEIALSTNNLNFGEVAIGNTSDMELTISNIGGADLELYDAYTSNAVFTSDFTASTLAPGDSMLVIVTFEPEENTNYSETLTIESNDDTVEVTLIGEGIGPVDVTMTPLNPPIVIPETGGDFDFNIAVANLTSIAQTTDLWTYIFLPNGGIVGPTINISGMTFSPNFAGNRDRNQVVPEFAPGGTYTYKGYVGQYPWVIDDWDSFTFFKEGNDGGYIGSVDDWICTGEPFDGEFIASNIPDRTVLHSAYPNPFNASTVISFELRVASDVKLMVFDVQGREVRSLVTGYLSLGYHEIVFDGTDLSNGVYFAKLQAGNITKSMKMLLLK